MEEIIVELASYNCLSKNTSSDFVSKLSKPITLNEGDTVMVRNCFLDTRLISNQFITFDEDQNINLTFYYYLMYTGYQQGYFTSYNNAGENPFVKLTTPDLADGLPYVLRSWNENINGPGIPITSQVNFTIPAGTYSLDNLATYMSRELQKCNEVQNTSFNNGTFGYYGANQNNNVRLETPLTNLLLREWAKDMYKLYITDVQGNFYYQEVCIVPLLNAADLNNRGSNGYSQGYISSWYNSNFNDIFGGFIGPSEFSIQYNNENTGKFEFTYMHTPIKDAQGNEVVCFRRNAPGTSPLRYAFNNRLCGIMFKDMQPRAFWEQLGFNVDSMLVNDEQIINREITLSQFDSVTTKNFMGFQDMYPNTTFDIKDNNPDDKKNTETSLQLTLNSATSYPLNIYYQSEKTWPIIAQNPPISGSSTGGHYLLEIREYDSEYINNDKEYKIKGIIPTYYLSQDSFATSYQDTLTYIHHGEPLQLNLMSVRILNPITKDLSPLGDNNTIYLQIMKNNSSEQFVKK